MKRTCFKPLQHGIASTELNFSLLEIGLCLTLTLSSILKHLPSSKAVKHDVSGGHRKVMVKHCD